ncbi:MAG: DNA polymerase III subunit beta [Deltaproteobacteria bacterium]|nr:DNA polymerase III subunit beta [Deltaproteobacteria bacterium]
MELKIARDEILPLVSKTLGIVEKKTTMPILSNLYLEATNSGEVVVNATDLEVGISDKCSGEVVKQGSITIRAKNFYDVLKSLPDEPIVISSDTGDWIHIECGKIEFNLVGLPVDDFPKFPEISTIDYIQLPPADLSAMFRKVYFAVSTDETRYNLNGVYIRIIDGKLVMVSTDGHRLCKIENDIEIKDIPEYLDKGIILPRKGILELNKIIEEYKGDSIKFSVYENNAFFIIDQLIFVMRIIDGDFPDFHKVLPESFSCKAVIDRDVLAQSLKRISVLSYDNAWGLRLVFRGDELEIQSNNPDLGEAKEIVSLGSYEGDELTIGFNSKYLLEAINAMDNGDIDLTFTDDLKPGLFKNSGEDNYLCVIMPMRI